MKPKVSPEATIAALNESPDNQPYIEAPAAGNYPDLVRLAGTILTGKKWETGRTLTVKFMLGVEPRVAVRIRETAEKWLDHVNLNLKWATSIDEAAEIRIAGAPSEGSWSYLGTDALLIAPDEPTLNFGWLTPDLDQAEYDRVVLHEFGHAWGFPHEHQHPQANIPWDREAVLAYYQGPPNNWSAEDIETNIFYRYAESITRFSEFDRESVMLYPIPNELTHGDFQVGWNLELSEGDKKFARFQYPFPYAPPAPEEEEGDPFEELPRVAISAYHRGHAYNREAVVTRDRQEVAYSIPLEKAERRARE